MEKNSAQSVSKLTMVVWEMNIEGYTPSQDGNNNMMMQTYNV